MIVIDEENRNNGGVYINDFEICDKTLVDNYSTNGLIA